MTSIHLLGMTTEELQTLCESMGQPKFRGKQVARWIYTRNAESTDAMSDLPAQFRTMLQEVAVVRESTVITENRSPDGTAKYLLQMQDKQRIEAVLLPYKDRTSVCASTQVGCAAGCTFCATAIGGFSRNLTAGEIVEEILTLQQYSQRRISNVVFMGMGEPLLNYENLLKSISLLTHEVGIASRHITISTVGIIPRIRTLAAEKLQVTLAISLHAPDDELRRQLIPVAARYPLDELIEACRYYTEQTHRRITFEYLMLNGINDSVECAKKLAALLRGMLCNVNLIPYNGVDGLELRRPSRLQITAFRSTLEDAGIVVTQRMEKGSSISAACGQLRRRNSE